MPDGVTTSIALGTVDGSTVQCGSPLATAHTPKLNGWGVLANPRAWSALKPSCPVSTTEKDQPDFGVPRDDLGTLKVMKREIELALIVTVPSVVAVRVEVRLPESLDLDQPVPG